MQVDYLSALEVVERLACLPYYSSLRPDAVRELANVIVGVDMESVERAIKSLVSDPARGSSPTTNRVPSPGELRAWVEAQVEADRPEWSPPKPPSDPDWCKRCSGTKEVGRHGWKSIHKWGSDEWMADWRSSFEPCPDCQDARES